MRINRIENELDIIDAGLITENPTSVLSAFLSTHAWIVDVLMLVFVVSGVYRCYKTKTVMRKISKICLTKTEQRINITRTKIMIHSHVLRSLYCYLLYGYCLQHCK